MIQLSRVRCAFPEPDGSWCSCCLPAVVLSPGSVVVDDDVLAEFPYLKGFYLTHPGEVKVFCYPLRVQGGDLDHLQDSVFQLAGGHRDIRAPHLVLHRLPLVGDFSRPVHWDLRSEEHTSELQSRENLVCRLLLEK